MRFHLNKRILSLLCFQVNYNRNITYNAIAKKIKEGVSKWHLALQFSISPRIVFLWSWWVTCHVSFVWVQFLDINITGPRWYSFFLKSQIWVAFQKIHINPYFFCLIHILLLISFRNHQSTGDFRRKKISPGGVLLYIIPTYIYI